MTVLSKGRIFIVLLAGLFLSSAFSNEVKKDRISSKGTLPIQAEQLGGDERYLVYTSLDKPVYKAGESLYLRATFLNAADNTPLANGVANITVDIKGPKGNSVFNTSAQVDDSTAGAKWEIPAGTPGGKYTALVTSPNLGVPSSERTFEIRAYRAPRLKTQVEFLREGYGAGDTVQASINIERAEGGIPEKARVTVIARVDGNQVFSKSGYKIDKHGVVSTQFKLPNKISVGDGSLSFVIEDGGVVETASKTIPIIVQSMSIHFYPEGGDLVAGLSSRVYVQANRPDGKPADIVGQIFELNAKGEVGKTVAKLATSHEGRGVFSISPLADKEYALVLESPSGIDRKFKLNEIKATGTVLKSEKPTFDFDEPVSMVLSSNSINKPSKITLYKRDQLLDSQAVTSNGKVELNAKEGEGVLIATVWSADNTPLAERLVYRNPKFSVNVSFTLNEEQYVPGQQVSIEVKASDENGKPVEAVVGLTVTDDAVLEIIEKREQAPRLPVMVYLENEVTDLADAHVYLDVDNESASEAVDLLLGTQGWRRFILAFYQDIKNNHKDAASRALAESNPRREVLEEVVVTAMRQDRRLFKNKVNDMAVAENVVQAEPDVDFFDERALAANAVAPQVDGIENDAVENDVIVNKEKVDETRIEEIIVGGPVATRPFKLEDRNQQAGALAEAAIVMPWPREPRVVVREYAHKVRENRKPNDRVDFTETLYWNKGIKTNARDGKATIKFDLSDSVTSFRVIADAFGRNGALGTGNVLIRSIEPFFIEPKMPLEASVGDVIELPIAMVNASADTLGTAKLLVKANDLTIVQAPNIELVAGERKRALIKVIADKPGEYPIVFNATAGPYADRVTRTLTVKANGFPMSESYGGLLNSEKSFSTEFTIPKGIEAGSINAVAKVYPSPLANMEEALNALLRQPNGCFEQTSSTTYPLVMAQQYFLSHQGVQPEKIAKAKTLLSQGYKKLTGFESKDKGYEWFGANPAHEALTAYGLMEFVDMAKVMPVDESMIQRTRDWLLARRDGNGGFKRNANSIDSFGSAPPLTTDAYIVWSLLESGESPRTLSREIEAIKQKALKSKDSYVLALAANILYLAKDLTTAEKMSQKLAEAVDGSGAVTSGETTITRSGGDSLLIETTSLTLLAWLRNDAQWAAQVETSMKWLFERSESGRFGSTQSTILALKAINAYDAARAKPKQAGKVQLLVDGEKFGKPVTFNKDSKGAIELPDFSVALTSGKHSLTLEMEDGSEMPLAVELNYNTPLPVSNHASVIKIETTLSADKATEGDPLEMMVSVIVGEDDAPTPMAIIGLPAGLDVRHDQLKELLGSERISSYEVIGREVILYWRALAANETRVIPLSLTANVPGTFTGPASRAYLYYTDEHKHWVAGHVVTVTPK